jgi:hypothetical protein
MSEVGGYMLRIATKEWVNHVFDMAIYYTNLKRKWKPRHVILFIHKTSSGDSVVGYGVVGRICQRDELSEEEKSECEKGGWKTAIEFKYVKKFEKPLLVKATFLKDSKLRGRLLHGLRLNREQLEKVVNQAETS